MTFSFTISEGNFMFKFFIPFAHAQSIYEIEPEFYKKFGIKVLFIDLDNTLDSYRSKLPSERAKELAAKLLAAGVKPVIISNNRGTRVSTYANALGVEYVHGAGKPFARKIKREIAARGLTPDEVMLVGDQIITDVSAGKNAGIRVVLTEKLVKEDQFTTHFNRLLDRPIRKYHRKRGNLRNWRTL